jgi:hypothetical protein
VRRVGGGCLYAWERGRIAPLCKDKFGPRRSVAATTALAKQCLEEVNMFMVEERVGGHIWLAPPWRRVGPGEHGYAVLKHRGDPMLDIERDGDFVHPDNAAP